MTRAVPAWARRRLDPDERHGLRLTLFAVAAILVAVPFSYLLLQVLGAGPVTEVDRRVAGAVHDWVRDSGALVALAFALSFLGGAPWFYAIVGASAYWFYRRGYGRLASFVVTTPLIGGAINASVKVLVDRPRPELDEPIAEAFGKSFPSGHAMTSTVAYGTLLLAFMPVIPRRWRARAVAAYVALVLLISASRLGLGVHYLSDVLGGIVLGAAWLCASVAAFRIWRREQRKRLTDLLDEGVEPEAGTEA